MGPFFIVGRFVVDSPASIHICSAVLLSAWRHSDLFLGISLIIELLDAGRRVLRGAKAAVVSFKG